LIITQKIDNLLWMLCVCGGYRTGICEREIQTLKTKQKI
jgi:hypothetical protein